MLAEPAASHSIAVVRSCLVDAQTLVKCCETCSAGGTGAASGLAAGCRGLGKQDQGYLTDRGTSRVDSSQTARCTGGSHAAVAAPASRLVVARVPQQRRSPVCRSRDFVVSMQFCICDALLVLVLPLLSCHYLPCRPPALCKERYCNRKDHVPDVAEESFEDSRDIPSADCQPCTAAAC